MQRPDRVGLAQRAMIDAADRAAVILGSQFERRERRAHRAVEDENALRQRGEERVHAGRHLAASIASNEAGFSSAERSPSSALLRKRARATRRIIFALRV